MATKFTPKKKKITGTKKKDTIKWVNKKGWKSALTVNAGNGDDVINFKGSNYAKNKLNGGSGKDTIYGGKKADSINGGSGNDKLYGYNGNDTIKGSSGNDTITGGKNNDIIHTGTGTNTVIINKGDGNDTIYHQGTKTIIKVNGAKASDRKILTKSGNDLIISYTHSGTTSTEKITLKNYFNGNKNIYLGNTKIETLIKSAGMHITLPTTGGKVTGTSGSDIINGGYGDDYIDGGAGNDKIYGDGGSNTLIGGIGNDSIYGGLGISRIYAGEGNDYVEAYHDTVYAGDGDDIVKAEKSSIYGEAGDDNISNIGLQGSDTDVEVKISGGDGNDTITNQQYAYAHTLKGDGGNDSIVNYGTVINGIYGGTEDDVIINRVDSFAQDIFGDEGNDVIINNGHANNHIEGGSGNDEITNMGYAGIIVGGTGNDTITTDVNSNSSVSICYDNGDGNDTLYLNASASNLIFAEGIVDFNFDIQEKDLIIKYNNNQDSITIKDYTDNTNDIYLHYTANHISSYYNRLLINVFKESRFEDLEFTHDSGSIIGNLTITDKTDSKKTMTISGFGLSNLNSSFNFNQIICSDGIHNIYDEAVISVPTFNNQDIIYNINVQNTTGSFGTYVYGGYGNDVITSSTSSAHIYGGNGNDNITNSGSNSNIQGDAGNDTITTTVNSSASICYNNGDGNDTLCLNASTNHIKFGVETGIKTYYWSGNDLIISYNNNLDSITIKDYNPSNSDITVYIVNQISSTSSTTVHLSTLVPEKPNIHIVGTNQGDTINGTDRSEFIDGRSGNDTLYGGNGADTIYGHSNMSIDAENDDDVIYGGEGADSIDGNAGNDIIYGGKGNDTIWGGFGADTIVFATGDGNDILASNTDGIEHTIKFSDIDLSDVTYEEVDTDLILRYGNNDSITLKKTYNNITVPNYTYQNLEGQNEHDKLTLTEFKQGKKNIIITESNTTTYGTSISDSIVGSDGNDTIVANKGNDTINGGLGNNTFIFYTGDGQDTIIDGGGASTIVFNNTDMNDLTLEATSQENHLKIKYSDNDYVILDNFLSLNNDNFLVIDKNNIQKDLITLINDIGINIVLTGTNTYGTQYSDIISGNNYTSNSIWGLGGNDTIYDNTGYSIIYGGDGDDVIYTKTRPNNINGGQLSGGSGSDTFIFKKGDGNHRIYYEDDISENDDDCIKFVDVKFSDITCSKSGSNNLIIYYNKDDSDDFIKIDQFLNPNNYTTVSNVIALNDDNILETKSINDFLKIAPIRIEESTKNITGTIYSDIIIGNSENNSISGGAGDDIIYGITQYDTLYGGAGNDTIYAGSMSSKLCGGIGKDVLYSGDGNNSFIFGLGDGNDTIYSGTHTDTIEIDSDVNFTFVKQNNDLVINYSDNDSITLPDYFSTTHSVKNVKISNNTTLLSSLIYNNLMVKGTDNDDTITVTGTNNVIIIPGKGNDTIYSENGNNVFEFSIGDGSNIIKNYGYGGDTVHIIGESIVYNLIKGANNNDLIIRYRQGSSTEDFDFIILEDYYLDNSHSVTKLKINNGETLNISDLNKEEGEYRNIIGSNDDNTLSVSNNFETRPAHIYSLAGNDYIYAYSGIGDIIHAGDGNDTINAQLNQYSLIAYGENGNDTIYGGYGASTIYGGNGDDYIQVQYNNTYTCNLYGGDGNDIILAGAGDDVIYGGPGDDYISGGSNLNAIYFYKGDGNDIIKKGTGNSIRFEDINLNLHQLFATYDENNDIVISYGINDSITFENCKTLNDLDASTTYLYYINGETTLAGYPDHDYCKISSLVSGWLSNTNDLVTEAENNGDYTSTPQELIAAYWTNNTIT